MEVRIPSISFSGSEKMEKLPPLIGQNSKITSGLGEKQTPISYPEPLLLTEAMEAPKSNLDVQVGGNHYKKYKIQPIEYAMANNLNYCQANVVKYTTRYRDKGGVEDLRKAIHNLELLIEMEENGGLE